MARVGALGDVLLTRRLTYSLSLAGFRTTLLAPWRHAHLLLADAWIEAVLDVESARFASVFGGEWPGGAGTFDLALLISDSQDLARAAKQAAAKVARIEPSPRRDDVLVSRQWAEAAGPICPPFTGALPRLGSKATADIAPGAAFIHPGSGSSAKNWPLERFVKLSEGLEASGHRVVWILGPAEGDFGVASADAAVMRDPPLSTLAATLFRAGLYIGNDSGVSHLAGALGTPTVALFGPTSPRVWGPDGSSVQTVRAPSGRLGDIEVGEVLAAAMTLTSNRS